MKLSIGMPFFNAEITLADAIRSVFAQTFQEWELLLIDDGSSDRSLEIARKIKDPRVRLICDGIHKGLSTRLNEIASLAQGEYLARMDADDLMHPERLERQILFLDQNRNVDLVDTAIFTMDQNHTVIGIRGEAGLDATPAAVLKRGLLTHPTVTGRSGWFRRNPYDPSFVRAEDLELWCRTCARTVFARLPEPLFYYRESLSGNLRNYLQTARTIRRIFRVYGPPVVGSYRTVLLIARSYGKSATYRACTPLGWQSLLIKKRNRLPSAVEAEAARTIIRRILSTALPGLSHCSPSTGKRDRHETANVPC